MKKSTTFAELESELNKDPEYVDAVRKLKPYFKLSSTIIRRRIELGLTQEQLANKANISLRTLVNIEDFQHNVTFKTIVSIMDALEIEFL